MDTVSPNNILNAVQAARLLGVSKDTIYELTRQNKIPHRYIGRQPRYPVWLLKDWFDKWREER